MFVASLAVFKDVASSRFVYCNFPPEGPILCTFESWHQRWMKARALEGKTPTRAKLALQFNSLKVPRKLTEQILSLQKQHSTQGCTDISNLSTGRLSSNNQYAGTVSFVRNRLLSIREGAKHNAVNQPSCEAPPSASRVVSLSCKA